MAQRNELDRSVGAQPLYRQICESFRTRIAAGALPLGSRLPTVRTLSRELGVARQTVVDAYRQLVELGLVEAQVGRDTRVVRQLPAPEARIRLAELLDSGPIADFEALSAAAGMRSLATAVPDPYFFSADEFFAEMRDLQSSSPWLFYYAPADGIPELRRAIARLTRLDGIDEDGSGTLVTLGATHALGLIFDELCQAGDEVLIEEPGFLGLPDFLAVRGLRVRFFPRDGELPCPGKAPLMLVWPSFGPATGQVSSLSRRQSLVEYAEANRIHVVEDAHYRRIAFGSVPPPLRGVSPSKWVLHVDSLSGYLAPGLRTGWIGGDPDLIERLRRRVRGQGTAGIAFSQAAIARYLEAGRLATHLDRALPRYRSRAAALVSSLRFEWPAACHWNEPLGGFSVWVTLPEGPDYRGLYEEALAQGVPFAPGALFGMPDRMLRISFGVLRTEAMREAAATLGRIVARRCPPSHA